MGVVKRWLKRMEESRAKQVSFFFVSMIVLCVCYLLGMELLDRNFEIIEDDYSWVYQVDSVTVEDDTLKISGWAFALGNDAREKQFEILLRDDTGKTIYTNMTYVRRDDVNNYFLCEVDYAESGFEASISTEELDLENQVYEIILKPRKKRVAFSTEIYYADRKIVYVHPDDYVPLKVEGTALKDIVEEGVLRVYRPEHGMYVYQHEKNLYWIAEENCEFVNKQLTFIDCTIDTTQPFYLPEDRKANNYLSDNCDFYFQEKECEYSDFGCYRVASINADKEYSITKILTGYRENGEWVWLDVFRIYFDFE